MPASTFELKIRFYDQAPALSLTVADGPTHMGRMRVEITPHSKGFSHMPFRPMMEIAPGDSTLFRAFYERYRRLWEDSTGYITITANKMEVDRKLDASISRELGLPAWNPAWSTAPLAGE